MGLISDGAFAQRSILIRQKIHLVVLFYSPNGSDLLDKKQKAMIFGAPIFFCKKRRCLSLLHYSTLIYKVMSDSAQ